MPHLFRTLDGKLWEPREILSLTLADGTSVGGIWGGSAQEEKLRWWLSHPGNELAQSEVVAEIVIKSDDTKEIRWAAAPVGARLIFLLEAPALSKIGERYRLAKMVATAANPAEVAYFHHERTSLFGTLNPDGSISKITPLQPPPPEPPDQGELF